MVTNCKHRISESFTTKCNSRQREKSQTYNERLCPTCNVLGDEFHCLFECENTRHIRHVSPRYYTFRPNMLKFSSLLSSEEPSVLRKLVFSYIYVILSIRIHVLIHTHTQNCITLLHHCSRFICCHAILRVIHALVYICLYVCTQIVNLLLKKPTHMTLRR